LIAFDLTKIDEFNLELSIVYCVFLAWNITFEVNT